MPYELESPERIGAALPTIQWTPRRAPDADPPPTYTFKNGAEATVHHVGQMTIAHIAQSAQKRFPPVPVPTFAVDLGNGMQQEPNPASPEYRAAVDARAGQVNLAIMDALMELAIDIAIDTDALGHIQATMARVGMPLEEISDKVAYIKHCCLTDGSEMAALGNLLRGITEEAIDDAAATFPSPVPRETAGAVERATIRRHVQPVI